MEDPLQDEVVRKRRDEAEHEEHAGIKAVPEERSTPAETAEDCTGPGHQPLEAGPGHGLGRHGAVLAAAGRKRPMTRVASYTKG